jgi:hypothetical protein
MKTKFTKSWNMDKLFTVNNFKYDKSKFILSIGPDVFEFARKKLGYNLSKPKKLESFLRKCFRSYWATKNK